MSVLGDETAWYALSQRVETVIVNGSTTKFTNCSLLPNSNFMHYGNGDRSCIASLRKPRLSAQQCIDDFARKSGAALSPMSSEAASFFNSVCAALGSIPHQQMQLGDENNDGQLDVNGYPAAGGDSVGAELYSWLLNPGYPRSVDIGATELVNFLNLLASSCPSEAVVLGGHSQGGDLIGSTLERIGSNRLSAVARSHIAYLATYGDPHNSAYLTSNSGTYPCVHGPWMYGSVRCGSMPIGGLLGARMPYVPLDFAFRTGSWCDVNDGMCNANWVSCATGCGTHNTAYTGASGWIASSAQVIAEAARWRLIAFKSYSFPYDQLLPTLDSLTATLMMPLAPVTTNPLGPDFNHDGTPDIWTFNKHDAGSGKTVYYILDGRDPTQTLRVGATAFGWLDDHFSIAVGPDFNHDGWPDFYGFDKQDAGSGKTVYFILNGRAPDQFLQIGATAMGFTDANWDFGVVAS